MSLLHNEFPIVINAELARLVGLNEAIILQQLHYWTSTTSGVDHDGQRWIYNTQEQWQEQFPFWSVDTVKRAFTSLKKQGLILVAQLAKSKHDRTNYYAIDHGKLGEISSQTRVVADEGKLPSSSGAKRPYRAVHPALVEHSKLPSSIGAICPDVHTETTTENTAEIVAPDAGASDGDLIADEGVNTAQSGMFTEPDKRSRRPEDMPGPKDPECKTYKAWTAYAYRYRQKYGVYPLWNAQAGKLVTHLVDRVGIEEAHFVAEHFIRINSKHYIERMHPLDLLLKDCQAIRTQWLTGQTMTATKAAQTDKTQTNLDTANDLEASIRARHAERAAHANC